MLPRELKEWRKTRGLSQAQLAKRLEVSTDTVRFWESGRNPVPPRLRDTLNGLAILEDQGISNERLMEAIALKKRDELARGQQFIAWYNDRMGTRFALVEGGENPDLTFSDGNKTLRAEVTRAFYDERDARIIFGMARGELRGMVQHGLIVNPDNALIDNILAAIYRKLNRDYGPNCVLLVAVSPALTRLREIQSELKPEDLDRVIRHVIKDRPCPFGAIYLVGHFPNPEDYQVWQMWPKAGAK